MVNFIKKNIVPNALIKKIHEQTGKSTKDLEYIYKKVEKSAKKSGASNPYAVANSIVNKMTRYKPKD